LSKEDPPFSAKKTQKYRERKKPRREGFKWNEN
jgi:hypothetical protein